MRWPTAGDESMRRSWRIHLASGLLVFALVMGGQIVRGNVDKSLGDLMVLGAALIACVVALWRMQRALNARGR
jgi:hypothetical protein